jgi:PKD repeat protein
MNNAYNIDMKKFTIHVILLLIIPTGLLAQYTGGAGRGDFLFSCINPTSGGTISSDQTGCNPFTPVVFTSSALPAGHTGSLTYKWMKSTTSSTTGFSDIASSNADTYDPGTLTQTTWFKRIARVTCQSDWTGAAESNVVTVTVAVAKFVADKLTPQKNETVLFTDLTTGGATSWTWSFDRPSVVFVTGTNSSSQNPQVQFTDGGLYTVTLLATNPGCSTSEIKSGYIRAGISGLWTGITSSEWNVSSNWDNDLTPGTNTDVVIPSSAPNWPVFTGNLIMGSHCRNLTLSGITSQITITGNLTFP